MAPMTTHMTALPSAAGVPTHRDRWIGIGRSTVSDPYRAGTRAADEALEGDDGRLLVVFCSDSYDLEELLAESGSAQAKFP